MSALSQVLPLLPMMASEGSLGLDEREGKEEGSLWVERRQAVVEAMRSYVRNGTTCVFVFYTGEVENAAVDGMVAGMYMYIYGR